MKSVGKISLRKVRPDDCDDIYRWRNDEETRQASFHSEPIDYELHKSWFEESLKNPNRYIYIAEDWEGNKIGVVRLDKRNEQVAEFDINVAPEMRGRSYGFQLIEQACQQFALEQSTLLFLARAKQDNSASIKVFKKAGFFEVFNYVDARWGGVVVLGKILVGRKFVNEGKLSSHREKASGDNKEVAKLRGD